MIRTLQGNNNIKQCTLFTKPQNLNSTKDSKIYFPLNLRIKIKKITKNIQYFYNDINGVVMDSRRSILLGYIKTKIFPYYFIFK